MAARLLAGPSVPPAIFVLPLFAGKRGIAVQNLARIDIILARNRAELLARASYHGRSVPQSDLRVIRTIPRAFSRAGRRASTLRRCRPRLLSPRPRSRKIAVLQRFSSVGRL